MPLIVATTFCLQRPRAAHTTRFDQFTCLICVPGHLYGTVKQFYDISDLVHYETQTEKLFTRTHSHVNFRYSFLVNLIRFPHELICEFLNGQIG